MLAVMNGHRESVMLLLEQSANPNAHDVNGCTAVHRGVRCIVRLGLEGTAVMSKIWGGQKSLES